MRTRPRLSLVVAFTLLAAGAGSAGAAKRSPIAYPHYLIAPGFSTNVVSVFDLRTGKRVKDIVNGKNGPCCAHATPDGRTVMVVDGFSPFVTTLDVASMSVRRQTPIPGPIGDVGSDVQDDGKLFWASNLPQGDIVAIEIGTGKVVKTYLRAGPHFVVRQDGRYLFTVNGGMLNAWDTRLDRIVGQVAISGGTGTNMTVLPGGRRLYAVDGSVEVLDISDPARMRKTADIAFAGPGYVGSLSADGRQFWIPGQDTKVLTVIDVQRSRVLREISMDAYGGGVVLSKDGRAYASVSRRPFPTTEGTALAATYLAVVPGAALGVPTSQERPIDPPGEIWVYDTRTFQRVKTPPMVLPGVSFVLDVVENPPRLAPGALG